MLGYLSIIKPIDIFGGHTEIAIVVLLIAVFALGYYKHTYKSKHSAEFEAYHNYLLKNRPKVLARHDHK